eukprot:TRINITY_DN3116_c0_g2_i3.p2 TRINITY_DN3116_c0_g2~~TRINITY_DN3116_c0_g2_i3.p2  ORF type:complete len:214 (-),score=82.11 TRINITY_DN3116_c0_g2_i3:1241-1882(-)
MVYYFTTKDPQGTEWFIYMGKHKEENEDLIKYGFPEDVWFHVDKLSSAHVYLRLPNGITIENIPENVLEDCCQLVKANSIEGNKENNVTIVYTPWANLKKTNGMEVGQVAFHQPKEVKKYKIEKRKNEIVNRLNKTKDEKFPDLPGMKAMREKEDREKAKKGAQDQREKEKMEKEEKEKEKELKSYASIMTVENMGKTNKEYSSWQEMEDDFM